VPHRNLSDLAIRLPPEAVEQARKEGLRSYRMAVSPIAAVAVIVLFAGVSFFADPSAVDNSAIGRQLSGPTDELWSLTFLLGGGMVAVGSLVPARWMELGGWLFMSVGLVMYAVAVVATAGALPAAFLALSLLAAALARATWLWRYGPQVIRAHPERRTGARGARTDRR
jgi:hypothetical protein